jgi:chitodextrinase
MITGLAPTTTYTYRVLAIDPSGNGPTASARAVVTTLAEWDRVAPRILSGPVVVALTDRTATLVWETDEAADSAVEYGPEMTYGSRRVAPEDVTTHQVVLTSLTPATTYHCRVASTDPSGNGPTWSGDLAFRTAPVPDLTLPMITRGPMVVETTERTATLVWETDELSTSVVVFGVISSEGLEVSDPAYVREHRVVLTHVQPATPYHATVGSTDPSGNGPTWSGALTFRTTEAPDTVPPVVPAALQARAGSKAVFLAWNLNVEQDIAGYNVYRDGRLLATAVRTPAYRDGGCENGVTYAYYVTAVDRASNESGPSDVVTATPSAEKAPSAPTPFSPRETAPALPVPPLGRAERHTCPRGRRVDLYL